MMTMPMDPSPHHPQDGEILREFVNSRSGAAFGRIVQRHGAMVLGVCRSVLGNVPDAEDAAQAVFITLARRATSLCNHPTLGGWLHRVAWYVARRAAESDTTRRRHELEAARMIPTTTSQSAEGLPAAEELHRGLSGLPDKYRVPILLHHIEGLTQEQIAQLMQVPLGTVSARLTRGRQLLRRKLAGAGVAVSATTLTCPVWGTAGAALPAGFVDATAAAAVKCVVAKGIIGGTISAQAATWAHGAVKMLLFAKLKVAAIVTVGVLAMGSLIATPAMLRNASALASPASADSTPPANPTPWIEFKGRVVGPDSKGMEGLKLRVSMGLAQARSFEELTTNVDGVFTVKTHPKADIHLTRIDTRGDLFASQIDGAQYSWNDVALRSGGAPLGEPPVIHMERGKAKLTGRVLDDAGRPVAGAQVSFGYHPQQNDTTGQTVQLVRLSTVGKSAGAGPLATTTNAEGRYELAVPPALYQLTDATGPQGSSLRAAPLWTRPGGILAALTPIDYDITIYNNMPALPAARPKPTPAVPAIQGAPIRWRTLTGRITDEQGRGVGGIKLTAVPGIILTHPEADIVTTTTDKDGRYELEHMPNSACVVNLEFAEGQNIAVDRSAENRYGGDGESFILDQAAVENGVFDINVGPACVVGINIIADQHVLGELGSQHLSFNVRAKWGDRGLSSNRFSPLRLRDGRYTGVVRVLEQGGTKALKRPLTSLSVGVWSPIGPFLAEPESVDLDLSNRPKSMDFQISAGASAEGTVVDAEGRPVPYAIVAPTPIDSNGKPFIARLRLPLARLADAAGRFTLRGLPDGDYLLNATITDQRNLCPSEPVRFTAVRTKPVTNLRLAMIPGAIISGRVLMPDGKPCAAASIGVMARPDEGKVPMPSHPAGRTLPCGPQPFRLVGLRPGRYGIRAHIVGSDTGIESPGFEGAAEVAVTAGQTLNMDIQLKAVSTDPRRGPPAPQPPAQNEPPVDPLDAL